jgi:hypothetical protein
MICRNGNRRPSTTGRGVYGNWDDQDSDGEIKAILEFILTDLNNPTEN